MKSWVKVLLFLLGGGILGGLYYRFFGCTGSCPITSNPYSTVAYFTLVAGLLSVLTLPDWPRKKQ